LGKGIRTSEAHLWARNYEWLPYRITVQEANIRSEPHRKRVQ